MVTVVIILYLNVAKGIEFPSSHHKKKYLVITVVMDVNWTYCGHHFAILINQYQIIILYLKKKKASS